MKYKSTARVLALTAFSLMIAGFALAQTPAQPRPEPTAEEYGNQPIAYVNGTTPITRAQLGEYLIERNGADRVEQFVNRIIILQECQRRGVSVTKAEVEAELDRNIQTLEIPKKAFFETMLPKYGKTAYEWMEDVVKPRLLLSKLCQDRVKIEEADLTRQFDREFGEQRKVQIIMWPNGDDKKAIMQQYGKLRESQEEFNSAARNMANPSLASSLGYIKPIRRHMYAEDKVVEEVAFELKEGEISEVIQTSQGYLVMKLHEIIPPQAGVAFEKERDRLYKIAYEEKLTMEIPLYFAELKKAANPTILFRGPTEWQYNEPKLPPAEGQVIEGLKQVEK